jgi:hypothetical protein
MADSLRSTEIVVLRRRRTPRPGPVAALFLAHIAMLPGAAAIAVATNTDDIGREEVELPDASTTRDTTRAFVMMPIPVSNPTIGTGLGAIAMYMYTLDEGSPPSASALVGMYTDTDSWMVGAFQRAYFGADTWRVRGGVGYMDLKLRFYGIGSDAGDRGMYVPMDQTGYFVITNALRRVYTDLYVGVNYRLMDIESIFKLSEIAPGEIELPDVPIGMLSSGLGLVAEYDTRDNQYYPFAGALADFTSTFTAEWLGSDDTYQIYEASYNGFHTLRERQILAYRAMGCHAAGDVPFWDLCMMGVRSDLRGYRGGQYRDRLMLAAQAEYRWQFWWRFGMVVFGGLGEVAPEVGKLNWNDILPSGGIGIRFQASPENRMNLRVDFARGKDDNAFYFAVGEAF